MTYTLTKIKNLDKYFLSHEKDDVIENALSKLIEMKIHQLEKEITELKNDLKRFEKKYHLRSERFVEKFQNGEAEKNGKLTRRWDNIPHHPEIETFPHHIHIKKDERVESSKSMDVLSVLKIIEREISK